MKELLTSFIDELTYITGSGKNAGKTTFLNYALKQLRPRSRIVLASIGVDGEGRDLIFGQHKPLIRVDVGDFVITSEQALKSSAAHFNILKVYPFKSVLGKTVFVEVLRGDTIELHGPETNSQLALILDDLKIDFPLQTVLVDGAVNRLTQIGSTNKFRCGVIDVIKVTPSTLRAAIERIRFLAWVKECSRSSLPPQPHPHEIPEDWFSVLGALTESKLSSLSSKVKNLVVPDYSHIFVPHQLLERLGLKVYFQNAVNIRGVIPVFHDVNEIDFMDQLRGSILAPANAIELLYPNPYGGSL